jgi:hypothetical protein
MIGRFVTANAREFSLDESRPRLRNGFAFYKLKRWLQLIKGYIEQQQQQQHININININKEHTRKRESSEFRVLRIDHSLESSSLTLIQRALKCGKLSRVRKYLTNQTK